jgi:cyclopropane fatty-acyl-phospholipid synthase-like methyltransferase
MGSLGTEKIPVLIEIGCGIGASAEYLDGHFDTYIGIDYSEEQIRYAHEAHKERAGRVSFLVKNIKELGTSDVPQADVVLAVGAFHHFTELEKVFSAITSVMKDGGRLIAIEPQRENPFVQLLRFIRTKIDKNYSSDQYYFTGDEFKKLLLDHGFSDVEIQYQGFFSPPFAQVALYPQAIFRPLAQCAVLLDRLCDKFLPTILKRMSWNIVARAQFLMKSPRD